MVDVAPTILALAGIEEPGWRGVDLLTGRAGSERAFNLGNLLFGEEWTGVRTAHLKYMRSEYGEERLFDLIVDPGEQVNQVGSMHEALAASARWCARCRPCGPTGRSRRPPRRERGSSEAGSRTQRSTSGSSTR